MNKAKELLSFSEQCIKKDRFRSAFITRSELLSYDNRIEESSSTVNYIESDDRFEIQLSKDDFIKVKIKKLINLIWTLLVEKFLLILSRS